MTEVQGPFRLITNNLNSTNKSYPSSCVGHSYRQPVIFQHGPICFEKLHKCFREWIDSDYIES